MVGLFERGILLLFYLRPCCPSTSSPPISAPQCHDQRHVPPHLDVFTLSHMLFLWKTHTKEDYLKGIDVYKVNLYDTKPSTFSFPSLPTKVRTTRLLYFLCHISLFPFLVYACVCVHVWVCKHICAHAYEATDSHWVPSQLLSTLLRDYFSLKLVLTVRLDELANTSQDSSCLCLPISGITGICHHA